MRLVRDQALDVVYVEILAHPRQIDECLCHRTGTLDRGGGTGERQIVPAQRDPHAQPARQLEQVGIIHAGQRQRIHAFHG